MAYCTPAEFILRYDSRRVRELLSDTGTPVPLADLEDNETLLALLEDASHRLKMAVRQSNRYSIDFLWYIYNGNPDYDDNPDPGSDEDTRKHEIIRIVADLAFGMLMARRGLAQKELFELAPMYKDALDMLEALKRGERIFDDWNDTTAEAGVHVANISPSSQSCVWTRQASRFFGAPGCDCGC